MVKKQKKIESIYFIGIKGMAMSGLAVIAKELGYEVSGSDNSYTYATEKIDQSFIDHRIRFYSGFDKEHIKDEKPDLAVVSSAYGIKNPEVKAVKSKRIPLKTHSEMLGFIMENYEGVGVSGVHGKTTTCSLLAYILEKSGFSPSYAIGAPEIFGLQGNAHIGSGKYFIAEADEYKKAEDNHQARFLDLPLHHLIITSIELDHPDIYDTAEDVYQAFYKLIIKIPRNGNIITCTDSTLVRRLVQRRADVFCSTYGFGSQCHYQIVNFKQNNKLTFSLKSQDQIIGPVESSLSGEHNALNITAALIMSIKLGVSVQSALDAIRKFEGVRRRFELLGHVKDVEFYDDFAHHPTALNYLIDTVRKRFPQKRLVMVFQPHTYSRTAKLLGEFALSLSKVDQLILLNIFASSREKSGYVTIKDLIAELSKYPLNLEYRSSLDEAADYLIGSIRSGDIVFLVGAGNVYEIFQKIKAK